MIYDSIILEFLQISNTEEVIRIVKRLSHASRVFTLGIGASASTYLVRGIASAGKGTCAFVESKDNIAGKVLNQLKDAMQPALSEVSVKWIGVDSATKVKVLNTVKSLFGYNKPMKIGTRNKEQKYEPQRYFQAPKEIPLLMDRNSYWLEYCQMLKSQRV